MTKFDTFPYDIDFNTIEILKKLNEANNKIGVLKGILDLLPNPDIILSILQISEAKDSSAIENIISTVENVYQELITKKTVDVAAKEIAAYKLALDFGFEKLQKNGFISTNSLVQIQGIVEPNKGGIRKVPGTVLLNDKTGEVVHEPPQNEKEIKELLKNLEQYINNKSTYDPLIDMALIHYQFETIHPFYDGNGRTGRILNILYLVLKEKIQYPVLYLSKYIYENRQDYYRLLGNSRKSPKALKEFVMYMLDGIKETAEYTVNLILKINDLINITKVEMMMRLPDIYSEEIVLHLFSYLYTKNEFFKEDLNISRPTATKYLKLLEKEGFLITERVGKEVVYKNVQLMNIFN